MVAESSGSGEIRLVDVTKTFGDMDAVKSIDLTIPHGSYCCLVGPSGCGKTTILRMIAGHETPTSGEIYIGDQMVVGLRPVQRGTAMMFQSYALWPHMDVAANIGYGLRMRGRPRDAIARRVDEMLKLLQLEGYGPRSIAALSGGQKQRVALGRALAVDPSVLLLDEPMSNLDYRVRLELRHELRALQKRVGITAVYVTHDREEALTLADRIAVIDAGRIAQLGTPDEVFHHPVSPFVAGFMGADNAIDVVRAGNAWAWNATPRAGPRARAHFRADRANLAAPGTAAPAGALAIDGTIVQRVYLGTVFRYRIHAGAEDFWVEDAARRDEGASVRVLVPPDGLLVFPEAA